MAQGAAEAAQAAAGQAEQTSVIAGATPITLNINGQDHAVTVEPRTTLLEALRFQLGLTGAKPVSLDGSSGASTVLIDGKPMSAENLLALSVRGKSIRTVESLQDDPVPKAFVENDAQQCGFCTPGFVVAVRAFLNQHPQATREEIRAGLNGNICRCGTYDNILLAALSVVKGGGNG
jgi:xanthine dehydrogenase YagT iron-sulfur-binding subunit